MSAAIVNQIRFLSSVALEKFARLSELAILSARDAMGLLEILFWRRSLPAQGGYIGSAGSDVEPRAADCSLTSQPCRRGQPCWLPHGRPSSRARAAPWR